MGETKIHSAATPSQTTGNGAPATQVYAVYGVEPEVQAYAMAKYSRSALSMKESLKEISEQRAEKFLNTFYFQYGHRSIADLAHIAVAIEKLSLLGAIAVVDEQRWDGQERSTRYQDFSHPDYYVPDFGDDRESISLYRQTADFLFSEYCELSEAALRYLKEHTPKPAEMKQEAYDRTLRARAFDISRYLLPLATHTSLGQIVNARTLESQVARLLSHTHAEVRGLGEALKRASREPAYDPNQGRSRELWEEINARDPMWGKKTYDLLRKEVRVAPTLVKYAEASAYQIESRRELRQAAAEIMSGMAMDPAEGPVDLLDDEPIEIELATTLLYEHSHYSYRKIRERVAGLSEARRNEIAGLGLRRRGAHDELLRAFSAGQKFRFDILMDIGGYRDMHRHRRCIQIGQDFTTLQGYEVPEEVTAASWEGRYRAAMSRAAEAAGRITAARAPEAEQAAQYLIPLAFRKRTLFKMDLAEVVYISELRTTPAGHWSYRRVAYAMYEEVVRRHPALAGCFRVHDIHEPVDLLQR